MKRLTSLTVFLILPLSLLALPQRAGAATFHPRWTKCILHFNAQGGFVHKSCRHYPILRETGHPVRKVWREIERTPTLSVRVTWPVLSDVVTRPALPGCPRAIAQWAPYIIGASRASGLPVRAISGVIAIESQGNAQATNPVSGAAGLMQFLPATAAALGINPYDPAQAIYAGARYLASAGPIAYSGGGYGWGLIYARGCD